MADAWRTPMDPSRRLALAALLHLVLAVPLAAAAAPAADRAALAAQARAWLLHRQAADGGFATLPRTLLVADALTAGGAGPDAAAARRALDAALRRQDAAGALVDPEDGFAVPTTALALTVLVRLGGEPATALAAARGYLLRAQIADAASPSHGGFATPPHAGDEVATLVDTAFALRALRAAGMAGDDPVCARALRFLSRCQHLAGANDRPWAGSDGSAVYTPVPGPGWLLDDAGGISHAGYGAMTHLVLESLLVAAGLGGDDPRVAAALGWLRAHPGFDRHPGMPAAHARDGLYFLHAQAALTWRACAVRGLDPGYRDGDILASLARRAHAVPLPDGRPGAFWLNRPDGLGEGDPLVCTAQALIALETIAADGGGP